jgi:hypothetical protein
MFVFSCLCCSKADERTHYQSIVDKYFPNCEIPTLQEIINQQEEYMKQFIKDPLYVKGDFNGDGKADFACICVDNKTGKLILFEQNAEEKYKINILDDDIPGYAGYYLDTKKRGELLITLHHMKGNCESVGYGPACYDEEKIYTPKSMVGDGLVFGRMESAASIIYWNGKKHERFWFSD